MERYLYLTLTPEALISSMLKPSEFGNYIAIGAKKRTRGQAIFFEIDQDLASDYIPWDFVEKRCIPDKIGNPKSSVYLSIYRVLEVIPLNALKNLYLVTDDGRVLELKKAKYNKKKETDNELHLYQELCPVTPRIASSLPPTKLMQLVTDKTHPIYVPKLVFVELILNELAIDPIKGSSDNLPYTNLEHLRDCLVSLQQTPDKSTKTVIRFFQGELLYRTCKNGFFAGSQGTFLYYPFPTIEELEGKYYTWWRSATLIG